MNAPLKTELRPRRSTRPGAGFLPALLCAAPAVAQCQPTWTAYPLAGPPRRNNVVFNLAVHDEDGPGPIPPALYAVDTCFFFGGQPYRTGRFDGWAWSTVPNVDDGSIPGAHVPNYRAIREAFSASGPRDLSGLFAGGTISYSGHRRLSPSVTRLDGGRWVSVDGGTYPGRVAAFALHDEDGSGPGLLHLFVGGQFAAVNGGHPPRKLARWDGRSFTSVGSGFASNNDDVDALLDSGADGLAPMSPSLFVGGSFSGVAGIAAYNIAQWAAQEWRNIGNSSGLDAEVRCLARFDEDGSGPRPPSLFVGGLFSHTSGVQRIDLGGGLARWDGENWSAVAGLTDGSITGVAVFDDDGPGPNRESLFVSGPWLHIDGAPYNGIARWDGRQWHRLGDGLGGFGLWSSAEALCAFDEDGEGPNPGGLYVGGAFDSVNGVQSTGFARWGCPLPPRCYADCDQSTGPNCLDVFDFLCFQNRYEINDPSACDCDLSTGPRACDLFDFLCFQNHFAAGCP